MINRAYAAEDSCKNSTEEVIDIVSTQKFDKIPLHRHFNLKTSKN